MLYKMTRALYDTLKNQEGLKAFTGETDSSSHVWLQFGVENGGSYRIYLISNDDDNDVSVRVYGLVSVDETRREKLIPVINELNCKFRYAKFVLDSDGDVNVEYDYPIQCPDPTASAKEIILRFTKIIDTSYPLLMRAMWA